MKVPRPATPLLRRRDVEMSEGARLPDEVNLQYVQYELEREHLFLDPIRQLISKDLSEPYSIYVYRYFLNQWGDLCYMVNLPLSSLLYHFVFG